MNPGDTFIPIGSMARSEHLHVVVSSPTKAGELAVVNLTTKRWDSDTCCTVNIGEHPWVQRETVALYSGARLIGTTSLANGIVKRVLREREPVDAALLRRLQERALSCDMTPQKVQAAVRKTLGL